MIPLRLGSLVAHQVKQDGLVISHPPREQSPALGVDHHAVVMFLADIHTGPCLLQHRLPVLANVCPQTTSPTYPYAAISSQFSMSSRVVAGCRAANRREPRRAKE